jgi:biopolymer transport protein TolR
MSQRKHRTDLVHAKPKDVPGPKSDINVTPLVDVCLVLLIIFMVITPMLQRGRDVPLPKTKHHEEKKDLGQQTIVSVAMVGGRAAYYFDKDRIEGASKAEELEKLKALTEDAMARQISKAKRDAKPPETTVFIKADANMKFGDIYPALIAVHEGGSDGVELGTTELKE